MSLKDKTYLHLFKMTYFYIYIYVLLRLATRFAHSRSFSTRLDPVAMFPHPPTSRFRTYRPAAESWPSCPPCCWWPAWAPSSYPSSTTFPSCSSAGLSRSGARSGRQASALSLTTVPKRFATAVCQSWAPSVSLNFFNNKKCKLIWLGMGFLNRTGAEIGY